MLGKLFLQYLLATVFGVGVDEGFATVYGTPGDKFSGPRMACVARGVPQDERICAHRWLPCGTEILVTNIKSGARTTCKVLDRGPYGVSEAGRWRGIIDLGPATARRVGVSGRSRVRLLYRLPSPGSKIYRRTTWLAPKPRRPPGKK